MTEKQGVPKDDQQHDKGNSEDVRFKRLGPNKDRLSTANQRGSSRGRHHMQHDVRTGGGDSNRFRPNLSRDGQKDGRQERQTNRWGRESRSNADTNWRDEGSKGDQASNGSAGKRQTKTNDSSSSSRHRQKHPDKELYSPRSAHWKQDSDSDRLQRTGGDSRTSQRPGLAPNWDNKPRKIEREKVPGPTTNVERKGSNSDISKATSAGKRDEDRRKDYSSGGSRSKVRPKRISRKKEDDIGTDNGHRTLNADKNMLRDDRPANGENNDKWSKNNKQGRLDGKATTKSEKQEHHQRKGSKYLDTDSKPNEEMSTSTAASKHLSEMLGIGIRRSPTMGLDREKPAGEALHPEGIEHGNKSAPGSAHVVQPLYANQYGYSDEPQYTNHPIYTDERTGEVTYAVGPSSFPGAAVVTPAAYPGQAPYPGSDVLYSGGQPVYFDAQYAAQPAFVGTGGAYTDFPVGAHAFGVYNPYDGNGEPTSPYGGEITGEVSIGRGAMWNEWYHDIWHGPHVVPDGSGSGVGRGRGTSNRGYKSSRDNSVRGRYLEREVKSRDKQIESKTIPNEKADTHHNKKEQDISSKKLTPKDSSQTAHSSDSQPQTSSSGFVRRNKDKSKTATRDKPTKVKSGKQFSGSSESQTGTLIEQLSDGTYECLVCCEAIKCEASVWNCESCYTVFHLRCIKDWAKSPAAASEDSDGWRCPACQNVTVRIPYVYKCFCQKTREPEWQPGDTPHSCGEVCRRKRAKNSSCTHPCNILCHPGPCPQCPVNVKRKCVCGKTTQTVRCGAVPVLRCQKACGKLLNCAVHVCEKICHEDKCEDCVIKISQGCYCGKKQQDVLCGASLAAKEGPDQFSCGEPCERELSCKSHQCKDLCHEGDCDPCPLTPKAVTHCPCGQTPYAKLIELEGGVERTQCTDPILTCQKICGKPLLCGGDNVHTCKLVCHEGACGPCPDISMVRCRCGHRYIDVPCKDIKMATPDHNPHLCDRKCPKRKSCGKHRCQQKCCVDSEHLCTQICGRKLNCGFHTCEAPCHAGNCIRCLEANFDELFCHCGAAVIMPPIPCGTKPPECNQSCARRHNCTHPVRHTCHSEEKCPPCAELTTKTCMGGHERRHNLPCYIEDVSCGNPCQKPLPCKLHTCQKTCHRGFCGTECSQPCSKPRMDCGHACNMPCHIGKPCPKQRCKAKVTIKCSCGHMSETMQCLQGVEDSQLTEAFQKMTTSAVASQLQFGQSSLDISQLMAFRENKGQRMLDCTEECARIERNRRFADALNIKDPDLLGNPGAPCYIQFLKEQAKKSPAFISSVEKEFAAVIKAVQSKYTSRTHAFSPMHRDQRRVIHELSDFYNLESQSYDQEPKRNVVVTARRDKSFVPSVTLSTVVQQETSRKAPTPIPHDTSRMALRFAPKPSKHSMSVLSVLEKTPPAVEEEVIDYFEMT